MLRGNTEPFKKISRTRHTSIIATDGRASYSSARQRLYSVAIHHRRSFPVIALALYLGHIKAPSLPNRISMSRGPVLINY
jgi:hypothetical protein